MNRYKDNSRGNFSRTARAKHKVNGFTNRRRGGFRL